MGLTPGRAPARVTLGVVWQASMSRPIFTKETQAPVPPRVVFFSREDEGSGRFVDVTGRVVRIQIVPVDGDEDGAHWLCRIDADGRQVWRTRHPSLKETFWHAEWEYQVMEGDWDKPRKQKGGGQAAGDT